MSKKEVPFAEKVYIDSLRRIRESWPKVLINIVVAFLIWLFGTSIFVPLGSGLIIAGIEMSYVIIGLTLIAIAVLIFIVAMDIRSIADGFAGIAAYKFGGVRVVTPEELDHYRTALRGVFYVIAVAVIFLVFTPLLDWISPAFRGVVLVLVFLWSVYQLYRAGMAIRAEISRIAEESVKRLEKGIRG